MSVTLTLNASPLTTEDIRWFLRDSPDKNILLPDDVEFSTEDIIRAIRFATAKYNAMTPQTTVAPETLNEYVLMCGVCAILLRSEGVRQNRNEMRSQDGNISNVNLDEKQAQYAQWADIMQREFDVLSRGIKTQNNMESCYSSFSSGYRILNSRFRW
jgi:hypothetical protein